MPEKHRQRTIRLKLSNMANASGGVIPTGFLALETALGIGRLPRGSIVELFGPASCGKTTLAIQIAANLQAHSLTVAWVDAEHTFDPARAAALGAAVESLPVVQPTSAEQ